jgi:mono/diheme cytochrome c family protein
MGAPLRDDPHASHRAAAHGDWIPVNGHIARLLSVIFCVCVVAAACSRGPAPSAAEGQSLYAESGCGSCHGASASGDGPVAHTLDPKPTDLHRASSFKTRYDEGALAEMLAVGIASHNHPAAIAGDAHHNQGMPPFAHLSEDERRSLALYVMSLNTDK